MKRNLQKISRYSFLNFLFLLFLLSNSVFGQSKPGEDSQKVSKSKAEQMIKAFKDHNASATIYGQTISKAQLDELVRTFPDCNAFSIYFGIDESGDYSGKNQYTIMIAPAHLNTENNTVKYVNDPGHDSSVYVPSMLCPDQCGLIQNQ